MNWEKFNEIKEGWKNYIFPNQEIEEMAEKRAIICSDCDKNGFGVCQECGCPLVAKTRSPKSKCPLNKWEINN